ncbi:hypothetical protein [Streptomyces sp. enrichment culture]|uniref:hypothetical protein n=1 Tax=Streptomyces sp. enrichment culture TaxID=1795815 RepID=UPI003F571712
MTSDENDRTTEPAGNDGNGNGGDGNATGRDGNATGGDGNATGGNGTGSDRNGNPGDDTVRAARPADGTPTAPASAPPASAPAAAPRAAAPAPRSRIAPRPSWVRRVLSHRTAVAATAAGLVGVLLGAGTVAWRTDTLPLLKPDPCWDSLSEGSVSALFGDRRLEVEEQRLRRDPSTVAYHYGQCRITSYRGDEALRQVTVRVHALDTMYGKDGRKWPAEFLSSRMVALGADLPGMVSASRAWLALPQSCVGRPGLAYGSTVVDVARGEHDFDNSFPDDREERAALARTVVDAANGVMRDLGCRGTYDAPGTLADLPEWQKAQPDAFCGVKGLELPAPHRKEVKFSRVSGEDGAARTCEAGRTRNATLRMSTLVDPGVSGIHDKELGSGGDPVKGTKGSGVISPTRAAYRMTCQTGAVVMTVETVDRVDHKDFVRTMLPRYVRAEAERIGCGPAEVKLPAP